MNPTVSQLQDTQLELVVAGTTEGVMMVESEARELSEEIMLGAVEFGHKEMQPVIDLIISMAEDCAKEPREVAEPAPVVAVIQDKVAAHATDAIAARTSWLIRALAAVLDVAKDAMMADLSADMGDDFDALVAGGAFKSLESDVVRGSILDTGMRIDGRDTKTVRQIIGEVGILPAPTVQRCLPGVKPRHWSRRPWAQARMSKSLTVWLANTVSASCCTITSHLILLVRRVAWVHQAVVKLVTASWLGVR